MALFEIQIINGEVEARRKPKPKHTGVNNEMKEEARKRRKIGYRTYDYYG